MAYVPIYGRVRANPPISTPGPAKMLIVPGPGDSITVDSGKVGPGGYRAPLLAMLNAVRPVEFVGTYTGGGDPGAHKGVDNISISLFLPPCGTVPVSWAEEYHKFGQPAVHLIYIGTNNEEASLYVADIIDPILAGNSTVKLLCAPLFPRTSGDHPTFNATMIAAVEGHAQFGTRVFLARSMATALTLADLDDGTHPTAAGYVKMAQCWFNELTAQGLI